MTIPANSVIISAIKTRLSSSINFSNAPVSDELITVIVEEIMAAVKNATVSTVVTGVLTPPSSVAGTGTGDPGTGTGLT